MKKSKLALIIIFIILLILSALVYIDYFIVKEKNTTPKISLMTEKKEFYVYNAILYKVWKCKSDNSIIIGDYSDPDAICKTSYEFNNGFYTNKNGLKISKENLYMLTLTGIYTHDMVEKMVTNEDINNALYVVSKYEMLEYNNITLKSGDKLKSLDGYEIIVFPTFKYNSKTDSYKWTYDTKNTNNYYCLDKKTESYSKYSNYSCGDFVKLTLDKKWCSLYKESTLSSNKEISKYCEN